jgi:hypothetical protein
MFSRQGKTTAAAMAIKFKRKAYTPATVRMHRTLQPEEMKKLVEQCAVEQQKAKPPARPSASFRNVSRSRLEHLGRDRTNAPGFDRYYPNYTAVQARVKSVPRYDLPHNSPRKERILVPNCLDDLRETYPRHHRTASSSRANRTSMQLDDFQQIVEARREPLSTAEPSPRRAHLITSFRQQLSRTEPKDSPLRAESAAVSPKDCMNLSFNHHSPCVPFALLTQRKALWNPRPQPEYSPHKDAITPRTSTTVLSFQKVTPRKSLALHYMLSNPPPAELRSLERGWTLIHHRDQSLPPMESITPRDDIMYRTLGMYTLNVPVRQLFP